MKQLEITDRQYWDSRWDRVKLPAEVREKDANLLTSELIGKFKMYLPGDKGLSILEVGGAPGQFLAFFSKSFGYGISAVDYSETGCEKLKENFRLLGLNGAVYMKDIIHDDLSVLPRFDIVYSLGFVEHFLDLDAIVSKHLELLRPGGILLLGVPNYGGISRHVLGRLAPRMLATHNLETMDDRNWDSFEEKHSLIRLFRGYIGGFEPRFFRRCEDRTPLNTMIRLFFKGTRALVTDRFRFLRKFNSRYWSAYLLGIYKKKE